MAVQTGSTEAGGQAAGVFTHRRSHLPLREHVLTCAGPGHAVPSLWNRLYSGHFSLLSLHPQHITIPPSADTFCARPEMPR